MNDEEFKRNLDLYGSDLERWPGDLRGAAREAISNSDLLQKLVDEEKQFEETLNLREVEAPSADLRDRIISSARARTGKGSKSIFGYLGDLFGTFYLPSPALSLALILIIGILIGYFTSSVNSLNNERQLTVSQLTFYEGDIYELDN